MTHLQGNVSQLEGRINDQISGVYRLKALISRECSTKNPVLQPGSNLFMHSSLVSQERNMLLRRVDCIMTYDIIIRSGPLTHDHNIG